MTDKPTRMLHARMTDKPTEPARDNGFGDGRDLGAQKPIVGLIAASDADARLCAAAIESCDARPLRIVPADYAAPGDALRHVYGLAFCGADVDGDGGGDDEVALMRAVLDCDMPIYAIGGAMLTLNIALGGLPPLPLDNHAAADCGDESASEYHHIYIAPGSRLAAVVGSGGFVRVNSRHRRGIREAQKSAWLLASAYSLEDGAIEALESARHRWVIGVQFRPERRMELPPHFHRLFQSLAERAAERMQAANSRQ